MRAIIVSLLMAIAANAFAASPPDAASLMERSYKTNRIKGSKMQLSFELKSASGTVRTRKVSSLGRQQAGGVDYSRRSRFESPADARGIATLLVEHSGRDDDLWVYVPALKKTRRLVADGKRDSFMGTVLSYGDVLGHNPALWTHKVLGEDQVDGHPCWRVESLPLTDPVRKQTGYSKRESCIDEATAFNVRMQTWDEAGQPLKLILNRQIREVPQQPGAFVAYELEARNLQSGDVTKIVVEQFEFAPALSDAAFSPNALGEDE